MATLSQLHLAAAASTNLPSLNVGARRLAPRGFACASAGSVRGLPRLYVRKCVSLRSVLARMSVKSEYQGDAEVVRNDVELAKVESDGLRLRLRLRSFKGVEMVASAAVFLQTALPAHAVVKDEIEEMMRFSPEEWINIYITTGVAAVLYLIVVPLIVMNYLRLRWYKRSFAETYFQFLLVFLFFPGLLLLAPFINFRPLPKDGSDNPW